jgi:hypothetical protein
MLYGGSNGEEAKNIIKAVTIIKSKDLVYNKDVISNNIEGK